MLSPPPLDDFRFGFCPQWRLRYILAVRAADAPAPGPAHDDAVDMTAKNQRGEADMVSHGPDSTQRSR